MSGLRMRIVSPREREARHPLSLSLHPCTRKTAATVDFPHYSHYLGRCDALVGPSPSAVHLISSRQGLEVELRLHMLLSAYLMIYCYRLGKGENIISPQAQWPTIIFQSNCCRLSHLYRLCSIRYLSRYTAFRVGLKVGFYACWVTHGPPEE